MMMATQTAVMVVPQIVRQSNLIGYAQEEVAQPLMYALSVNQGTFKMTQLTQRTEFQQQAEVMVSVLVLKNVMTVTLQTVTHELLTVLLNTTRYVLVALLHLQTFEKSVVQHMIRMMIIQNENFKRLHRIARH